MNIWIIDHYSVPPKYYPLARQTNFAKKLMKRGHIVTIFCASTVHNSDIDLIDDRSAFKEVECDGVKYVAIKCHGYKGNGIRRILNMLEFAYKLPSVCSKFEMPDAILSCSMTLQACKQGILLARKYNANVVAQVTDLWPETITAMGVASPKNILVKMLRRTEKWIYENCDSLVFSMEGAYDYIEEQGWSDSIPLSKVHYINNGIDISQFDVNKEEKTFIDADLQNNDIFKIVYTGSIRHANNVGVILDAAKLLSELPVRFLIWGDGDDVAELKNRIEVEKIENVLFKGKVAKEYIPFITSKADLCLAHFRYGSILKYGISFNKLFDYLASGTPVFTDFPCNYNPAIRGNGGVQIDDQTPENIADKIKELMNMEKSEYRLMGDNARRIAEEYDFEILTDKLEALLSKQEISVND